MAKDVREFHWTKSLNTIKNVEEDTSFISGLTSQLKPIKEDLESQDQKNKAMCSSEASKICPLLYRLDDILAECKTFSQQCKARKNFTRFNPLAKFLFGQRIKASLSDIKKDLEKIVQAGICSRSPPRISPKCCPTFDEINFFSNLRIDEYKTSIERSLFEGGSNNGLRAIGIVGMCGSGKTAVVKQVFNDHKVSGIFPNKIWVCLSDIQCYEKDPEAKILKFILEEMGKDVDMEANNYSIAELLGMLKDLLLGKRYLIVLDDMWHVTDFFVNLNERLSASKKEHFLRGLPRSCGGVVIITSRLEEAARRIVGDKYLIPIPPQLEEDLYCWNIFKQNLHPTLGIDEAALPTIKDEIIYQCHDLPLAAKTLATIFSESKEIQERLQHFL